jgi:hypothetical protein
VTPTGNLRRESVGAEAYARSQAAEHLGRDSDSMLTGDGRISAFAAGLKAYLRAMGPVGSLSIMCARDALDAAIDAFAAEFQKAK